MKRTGLRVAAASTFTALALMLSACAGDPEPAPTTFVGAEIDHDKRYAPSEVNLTDTAGEAASLVSKSEGKDVTLVFFGYTHCPDICGIVMSTLATAVTQLDEADRERVDMVFVTTDPARDDEKTLREYLDRYDPSFDGLTGDLDDIITVGKSMMVHVEEGEKLPSGGYEVVHSDHVVGLDSDGLGALVWNKEVSSRELADDIRLMLGS